MEDAGFKRRQIEAAAKKLGVLKTQQAGGWTWSMPAEQPVVQPPSTTGRFTEFDAFDPSNGWSDTGFDR